MKKVLAYGLKNMQGGLERYLLTMNQQLYKDLSFVYLVEQCDCIHKEQISQLGGEIIYLPSKHPLKENLKGLSAALKAQRNEIDTLYVNVNSITYDIAVILLGLFYQYRVVVHSHNAGMELIQHPAYRMLHKTLEFVILRLLKTMKITRLAVSDRAADYLFPGCPYEIVVPGTDVKNFAFDPVSRQHTRQKLGLEDAYVYGFVGILVDVKNPKFLLQVFEQVCLISDKDCRLLIVGGGPLREDLEEQTRQLGLSDRVIFVGDTKEPEKYYHAMDYLILPSQSEGLSLVAIEAQAAGLPIACSAGRFPGTIQLTPLVNFVALEDGAQAWADACIAHANQFRDSDRKQWNQRIFDSCFETEKAADSLRRVLCGGTENKSEAV